MPHPTRVRYMVVASATVTSLMLYLDRNCLSQAMPLIQRDLTISDVDAAWILGAFYLPYALFQVPSGWFSDRFGARIMLAFYVAAWSLFIGLTGLAVGTVMLFALRLLLGVAQAGAYPTSGALLSKWIPVTQRGSASSVVVFGGRIGGAIAPVLTAWLTAMALGNWRVPFYLYGLLGIASAYFFWWSYRDKPETHPHCNADAVNLIQRGIPPSNSQRRSGDEWRLFLALITSPSMWLMCISQCSTNIGWVFLVTLLPSYLDKAHNITGVQNGFLSGMPLTIGIVGTLIGGPLTDIATKRLGVRWGRALPLGLTRFIAALAYVMCLLTDNPYLIVSALCLMAIGTDLGIAATWAFMQDIGGRYVASCLGWGNMFGNFGAFIAPPLLVWVSKTSPTTYNWNAAFTVCTIAFLISGFSSLGINATHPIMPDDVEPSAV